MLPDFDVKIRRKSIKIVKIDFSYPKQISKVGQIVQAKNYIHVPEMEINETFFEKVSNTVRTELMPIERSLNGNFGKV